MNFQQLEYVLAVHQYKRFTEAAENCHVTQATLSAMIKKLEDELGIVIFDRSRFPVLTTEKGLQLIETAKEIISHKKQIEQLKYSQINKLNGTINLGIIPTIANSLLPIILPSLMEQNPDLKLQIQEITTQEIIQKLKADQLDLGILATPLDEDTLQEHIMYYEPLMIYGVRGNKKFTSSKDVQNQHIWLLEEDHCFRKQTETVCNMKENQSINQHLNFAANSFETLLNLTDKFGGYTLIPELYSKTMNANRQALTKPFNKPVPVREISLVSYRPYAMSQSTSYLSAFISKLIKPSLSTASMRAADMEIIGIN